MRLIRRIHNYLGVFFAPLLLFFVGTGWYQSFNPDRLKSPSEAESLAQKLRVVHTDQIFPSAGEVRRPASPRPFRALVSAMAAAMIVTTGLGLVLAFRVGRSRWPVVVALVAGLILPMLLLWAGQRR
jgi:hypothetical protein